MYHTILSLHQTTATKTTNWKQGTKLLLISLFCSNFNNRKIPHYYYSRAMSITSKTTMPSTTKTSATTITTKIAVAQLCSTASKWKNLCHVAMCAGWATSSSSSSSTTTTTPSTNNNNNNDNNEQADTATKMLFLPECFGFLGSNAEETIRAAESSESLQSSTATTKMNNPDYMHQYLKDIIRECSKLPINVIPTSMDSIPSIDTLSSSTFNEWDISLVEALRIIAQTSNLWISAGSVHILCNDANVNNNTTNDVTAKKVYNTHIIMDNTGTIRTTYNKIHLFNVCIPQQNVNLQESTTTVPGKQIQVCTDTPIGTIGLSICYDVRFPEVYTQLVQFHKARILLVPSAFTVPTGHAHWHTLLRARAIENQCYVIAAAQYGQHNAKRVSYGHSLVVDGWGTVIADAGGMDSTIQPSYEQPTIIVCDLDLSTIDSIRERMPIQQHRNDAPNFFTEQP